MTSSAAPLPPLVSVPWLTEQGTASDLLLFDASWFLPTEPQNALDAFRQAHIPGARFFDIDAIADHESKLPHMVPTAAQFERLTGALGIGDLHRVVFYDQKGIYSAPRAWWLMRLFGHERCAVLDGGLPQWRREGGALQQGEPAALPPTQPLASFNSRYLRGLGDMLDNLRTGRELVLDARSADRFHARVPEPRAGLRAGHIPGSRNLPFTELLTANQTLRAPAQLRERFAACGVDKAHTAVVTSCGSGMTAAILTLALEVAGFPVGGLYDGSWSEWGGRTDTPIER